MELLSIYLSASFLKTSTSSCEPQWPCCCGALGLTNPSKCSGTCYLFLSLPNSVLTPALTLPTHMSHLTFWGLFNASPFSFICFDADNRISFLLLLRSFHYAYLLQFLYHSSGSLPFYTLLLSPLSHFILNVDKGSKPLSVLFYQKNTQ